MKLNVPPLIQELALGHFYGNPPDPLADALSEYGMEAMAAHMKGATGHKNDGCSLLDALIHGTIPDFYRDVASWNAWIEDLKIWEIKPS